MVNHLLKKCMVFCIIFAMVFGMMPWEDITVYAFDPANFKVDSVSILRVYDRNRIAEKKILTVEGMNLKDAETGMMTYTDGYVSLTPHRTVNSEGVLQFELVDGQFGNEVKIEGISIPIDEASMPILTGVNRVVKMGSEDLVLQGSNLENIKNDVKITAKYQHDEGGAVDFDKNKFTEDTTDSTKWNLEKPIGTPGIQHMIFQREDSIVKDFPLNPGTTVKVSVAYTYKDQFQFLNEIKDVEDLQMFPNRGEKGDKVYFQAKILQEYDVYFLKAIDGTDPYTNENKGKNKTFQVGDGDKIDVLTVEVPDIDIGEYYVVLTNPVKADQDPMKEVNQVWVVRVNNSDPTSSEDKFTVTDGKTKPIIHDIQPNSGPDTGQEVTITGQFLGSLKIPEFQPDNANLLEVEKPDTDSDKETLEITYSGGIYNKTTTVTSVERKMKVIIGDKATFIDKQKDNEYDVEFDADLDVINVLTPQITDAATDPIKDVVIEIETIMSGCKDKDDGTAKQNIIIKERATLKDAYTYIPSKLAPTIEKVVPEKIQVDADLKVGEDTLVGIYGENFTVHKFVYDDGKEVTRYPIVQFGKDIILDKNSDETIDIKIFDNKGNELDGTTGNEVGSKILVKIPKDASIKNLGKTFVRIRNPIRNSMNMGLSGELSNAIAFVLPDASKVPIISKVTPDVVTVEGGEDVTITGNNFQGGVRVFIDGAEVQGIERSQDGKKIKFKAPPGREGETQLQVMNPEGAMDVHLFTYVKTYTDPKIIDFNPKEGNTGTLVVIKGDNFLKPDPTANEDSIYKLIGTRVLLEEMDVNEYNLNPDTKKIILKNYIASDTAGEILEIEDKDGKQSLKLQDYYHSVVLYDEIEDGFYTIEEDTQGNIYISAKGEYDYTLKLDEGIIKAEKNTGGVLPVNVDSDGTSDYIALDGKTFRIKTPFITDGESNMTIVKGKIIGDKVKVLGKNTIYFWVPILSADGYYDVTIVNPDTKRDSKVDKEGFYYFRQPQSNPEINDVDPPQGSTEGGYDVIIYGKDFMDDSVRKTKIIINGIEVSDQDVTVNVDGTAITVKVPAYTGDLRKDEDTDRLTVPIVVVNPDGGSACKEDGFTYVVPTSNPQIAKIVPQKGNAAGGDVVEITGFDFRYYEPFNDLNRDQALDEDEGETYEDVNKDGKWNNEAQIGTGNDWSEPKPLEHKLYDHYYASSVLPKIYFGKKQGKIVEFSKGYLKVLTPDGDAGGVDVYIVNNDSGISNKISFTYEASNPAIKSIVPAEGRKQGGDSVEIFGQNFTKTNMQIYGHSATTSMVRVNFGAITNKNIPREEENSGLINSGRTTVKLLGNLSIEYNGDTDSLRPIIEVNNKVYEIPGGITNYKDTEIYIPVSMLKDNEGNAYAGNELIRVYIEDRRLIVERGYAPEVEYIDASHIIVKTPSYYTVGKVPVVVINPDDGQAKGEFEYKNPDSSPKITNITKDGRNPEEEILEGKSVKLSKMSYKGGNMVSVIGADFRENASIQIGDVLTIKPNDITYQLPNKMTFKMPSVPQDQVGSTHRVVVVNEDGASTASNELNPPIYIQFTQGETLPAVNQIEPDQGPATGGTTVTIRGKDFREGLSVLIGDVPVQNLTIVDYKTLKIKTPPHEPGKYEVKIENHDGEISDPMGIYTYISAPTVISVVDPEDPAEASIMETISVEGGQEIKIKGSGFLDGARVLFSPNIKDGVEDEGEEIYFDENKNGEYDEKLYLIEGKEGTDVKVIDDGTIIVKTPEGKLDAIGIIVINPDQGASKKYEGIKYGLPEVSVPTEVSAELIYDRYIKVNWKAVEDAAEYEIHVVIDDHEKYLVGNTELTSFIYQDLEKDTKYKFVVTAIGKYGSSKYSMESNEVRTGSHVGPKDEDGELGEKTSIKKVGNTANIIIGQDDDDKEMNIDLTRGALAGSKEVIISIPSRVVASLDAKDVTVTGQDFVVKFNPNNFYSEKVREHKRERNAGVRFVMKPIEGDTNIVSTKQGQIVLSKQYLLKASVYVDQNSTEMTYLPAYVQVSLDVDRQKSDLRRVKYMDLSYYDEDEGEWIPIANGNGDSYAITGITDKLGKIAIIGSRRK
ncbi:IPT/TIG domain-containing protein [Marinisporobacter balticus]|uniref:IPT/TIG domain-containing protein n=1 Tax=Marinisporobacter balticus TaxID=2018667 RepID=A0A4R2L470_9FIRM|nr:IPT/TIG domain-containing protein [Marinisporobacter balticus]TCO78759.1 IPT/TIG domain-containing protein [Marinisporobacter balticus]